MGLGSCEAGPHAAKADLRLSSRASDLMAYVDGFPLQVRPMTARAAEHLRKPLPMPELCRLVAGERAVEGGWSWRIACDERETKSDADTQHC
jgi:hypothetical protein